MPPADQRIAYGPDSLQFGELRLPKGGSRGSGPYPVVVVIHGGCWQAEYDLVHIGPLCGALTERGYATWSLEYRRIGNGGGWPRTFEDVAAGTDYLRELAKTYPLDLGHVITMGHSAGGHLALWVAARKKLSPGAPGADDPLPLRGAVGLAAITDLAEYARGASFCMQSAATLMGGPPDSLATRYAQASPIELLPLGVPMILVHGSADKVVPTSQSQVFQLRAKEGGDHVKVATISGAGHFDVIAPTGASFEAIERAVKELLRAP